MEAESSKAIAHHYIDEVWNRGNVSAIAELVTADYRGSTRAAGQQPAHGPAGLARWVSGLFAAFTDVRKEVRTVICEGDDVVAEVAFSAVHAATGNAVSADQIYVLHLRDGRVATESIFFDVGGVQAAAGTALQCATR